MSDLLSTILPLISIFCLIVLILLCGCERNSKKLDTSEPSNKKIGDNLKKSVEEGRLKKDKSINKSSKKSLEVEALSKKNVKEQVKKSVKESSKKSLKTKPDEPSEKIPTGVDNQSSKVPNGQSKEIQTLAKIEPVPNTLQGECFEAPPEFFQHDQKMESKKPSPKVEQSMGFAILTESRIKAGKAVAKVEPVPNAPAAEGDYWQPPPETVVHDGKKIAETKKEYATFFFVGKDAMKASTYAKS